MLNQITSFGAAEISRQIRSGHISPLEVVEAQIAQIEKVNPKINALVTPTFAQARQEARQASELLATKPDNLPPLFGVPVTIKDALPVGGVRFTAGSIHYRNHIAKEDAQTVRRLREAGAIILGKTNCAELCGSVETNNLVFGLTRNPWNLAHSAGGSSGGEAALIAARGSPLGIGSDFAGSIRIPAAFCGIAGLKPSAGRVPTAGHFPPAPQLIAGWNTIGPLARGIEDLALALSVLSKTPTRDFRKIDLSDCRILIPKFLAALPVRQEIATTVYDAAVVLGDYGLQVIKDVKLPLLRVAYEYIAILYQEWLPQYQHLLGKEKLVRLLQEMYANWRGNGQMASATLPPLAMAEIAGATLRALGYGHMDQLEKLRKLIIDLMVPNSLLVWPVFPSTAPKHGFAWSLNSSPTYTSIFNALGFPSVVVPIRLSKKYLPLAVQIIGMPGEDEKALAVAEIIERELGDCPCPPIS